MNLTSEQIALLQSPHVEHRWGVRIHARNRTTGATEILSVWTGDDAATIGGVGWYGAGALIGIGQITERAGTAQISAIDVTLATPTPELASIGAGYTLRLAPVEVWLMVIDPATGAVHPSLILDGIAEGVEASATETTVKVVSDIRAGALTSARKRSDAAQRLRLASDTGRQYADVSGAVPVVWGEERKDSYRVWR